MYNSTLLIDAPYLAGGFGEVKVCSTGVLVDVFNFRSFGCAEERAQL